MSGLTYSGPVNPNPADGESSIIIYGYVPSLGLGIVGAVTFFLCLLANAWYIAVKRGYRSFHILLTVGSLMECGGYAVRIYAHYHPFLVATFVAQYFLIVVAPVVFSAAIYYSLTLLVRIIPSAEDLLALRPKRVLAVFITFDVICTIIQIAGAALIGTSESARVQGTKSSVTPEQANDILLAGLAIQSFSFLCFLVIVFLTIARVLRSHASAGAGTEIGRDGRALRMMLTVITVSAFCILLRTLFRLSETAQATHESLFEMLEYLPVILAVTLWTALPPSFFAIRAAGTAALPAVEKPAGRPSTMPGEAV